MSLCGGIGLSIGLYLHDLELFPCKQGKHLICVDCRDGFCGGGVQKCYAVVVVGRHFTTVV